MRLGFSILLAILAIFVAGRTGWAEPVRVSALEARVNTAVGELMTARAKERGTRDAQAVLSHRIAALKRLDRKNSDDALLERLLRESIDADRTLAAQIQDVRRRQQAVREAIERIDARRRELVPKLAESNPIAERRAAAKEIAQLRGIRNGVVARLKEEERHRNWADHVVTIDPLDGPSELADKSDVLALTQKKIEKKKQLLAQLIREKQIAQSARDFNTDATAADEDLRAGRVQRRGNETLLAADVDNNAESRVPVGAPQEDDLDPAAAIDDPTSFAGNAPPPDLEPARNDSAAQPQVGVPAPKTSVLVTPPAARPTPNVPKQIDANLLLNLDELDADKVDLATLEKYVFELERMQKALASQAQQIQRRAEQLEKDEARAKSK